MNGRSRANLFCILPILILDMFTDYLSKNPDHRLFLDIGAQIGKLIPTFFTCKQFQTTKNNLCIMCIWTI